jgi:hypothetical protein
MWHSPDAVLIGHKNTVVLPGETIRFVQILDVTVNPDSFACAVIPQESEITGALLSDQNVAVGQDE